MQTLLTIAVIVTALAIIAQAGLLLAMYILSRRLTGKADLIMDESRKVITPLQSVTDNLKDASNHAAESGRVAHAQMLHIQDMVNETHENIRGQVRQYGALADAVSEGLRTFFKGRKTERPEREGIVEDDRPAA
jgi:hypothetical protein